MGYKAAVCHEAVIIRVSMNQPRSTHVFKNKLTIKAGILLSQRAGFDSVCTGWEVYIEAGGAGRSPWCRPLLSTGDTDLRAMESQCWDHSQVWVPGRSDQASVVTEGSARASERGVKYLRHRWKRSSGVKLIRCGIWEVRENPG